MFWYAQQKRQRPLGLPGEKSSGSSYENLAPNPPDRADNSSFSGANVKDLKEPTVFFPLGGRRTPISISQRR